MRIFVIFISLLVPSFLLSGCASVQLNQFGKNVQYFKSIPASMSHEDLEEIDTLSCRKGVNFKNPADNMIQCKNELRNKAADLGADIFIVDHEQIGTGGSGYGQYSSGGCPNCISIVGTAYRYKK